MVVRVFTETQLDLQNQPLRREIGKRETHTYSQVRLDDRHNSHHSFLKRNTSTINPSNKDQGRVGSVIGNVRTAGDSLYSFHYQSLYDGDTVLRDQLLFQPIGFNSHVASYQEAR